MGKRSFVYALDSDLPPERILAALTDFTDRRPDLFPGLSRRQYKVIETGDGWALAREGTATLWAIERWDWSTPGVVRSVLQESNGLRAGTIWEFRVAARDGGGSRVEVHLERNYKGLTGLLTESVIVGLGGRKLLARYLQKTLYILQQEAV